MGTRLVGPSPGHLRSPLRSCSRDALFRTAAAKNLRVYLGLAWEKRAKDEKKDGSPGAAAADGPRDEEITQALKSLETFEAKVGVTPLFLPSSQRPSLRLPTSTDKLEAATAASEGGRTVVVYRSCELTNFPPFCWLQSGQQDNHCDCGVYVLQYIQEFFGAADGNKLVGANTTTMLEEWFRDTITLKNCDKKQIVRKRTDIRK